MPPKRSGGGAPLSAITERLNYLELRLADITPESSRVILERMVELEKTTRDNCNHAMRNNILYKDMLDQSLKKAEDLMQKAERLEDTLLKRIQRPHDLERQETTAVLAEMKDAIETADAKCAGILEASLLVEARIQGMEVQVQQVLVEAQEAKDHMGALSALEHRAVLAMRAELCTQAMDDREAILAKESAALVHRSRSVSPSGLPAVMREAQSIACRRRAASAEPGSRGRASAVPPSTPRTGTGRGRG